MAGNGKNGSSKNGKSPDNTWAGAGRRGDGKIRVAIVGVGNCASSLVQGRYYYEDAKEDDFVPGLMHVNLGGYHVRDIEFVAAFDIDKNKVGKDLSEAIYTKPNNTYVFQKVKHLGVPVERGMTHDGLGKYLSQVIEKAPGPTADIVSILKEREVDVMVSYLPVGSEEATKWYVEQALRAGVAFVNAIPVFIGVSRTGSAASPRKASRSSATTSRARSGRPSPTACSPACSWIAASASIGPTS
jgi:myo-inositol-1-phosphate synthase